MRLEPVYLVAPKPKPPSIPTRRAFLFSGGAFFFGALLGGACGYAAGASASADSSTGDGDPSTPSSPTAPEDIVLEPSGDADLDELRRLAVKAPIEELVEKSPMFLSLINDTYPDDKILWLGVERLGEELLRNETVPQRRALSRTISMIAQSNTAVLSEGLRSLIPQLNQVK